MVARIKLRATGPILIYAAGLLSSDSRSRRSLRAIGRRPGVIKIGPVNDAIASSPRSQAQGKLELK